MSDEKVAWYDREDWDTYELTPEEQKEMDDKEQEELALVPPPLFKVGNDDGCHHSMDDYLGRVLHPSYQDNHWCDLYLLVNKGGCEPYSLCMRYGNEGNEYYSGSDMRRILICMGSLSWNKGMDHQRLKDEAEFARSVRILILCFRKLGMSFMYEDMDLPRWIKTDIDVIDKTGTHKVACADGWMDYNCFSMWRKFYDSDNS